MVVENVLRADQTLPSYQCRTVVVLRSYRQSWTDKDWELWPRSDGFVMIMTDRGGLLWILWSGTSAKNDRHSVTWALCGELFNTLRQSDANFCISKLGHHWFRTSDNGLSPGRHQVIIWTNDGILLIGPLGKKFYEILIGIHTFSFKKILLKMLSGKWQPICLCLNVLNRWPFKLVSIFSHPQ